MPYSSLSGAYGGQYPVKSKGIQIERSEGRPSKERRQLTTQCKYSKKLKNWYKAYDKALNFQVGWATRALIYEETTSK